MITSMSSSRFPQVTTPPSTNSKPINEIHEYDTAAPITSTNNQMNNSKNPFLLPRDHILQMKEKNEAARADAKEKLKTMKIWDKPAKISNLINQTNEIQLSSEEDGNHSSPSDTKDSSYLSRVAARQAFLSSSSKHRYATSSAELARVTSDKQFFPTTHRSSEKTNMATFISQKRDMFLLNMSLATKRSEIEKLESKALMKEEALKKAEQMLEEDAMRFDAFLKENDRRAHESLKRAEREAREKNDCLTEMKKLNAEIGRVENELHKYEEQLGMQLKYKTFLDALTPETFKQEQCTIKQQRRQEKRKKLIEQNKLSFRQSVTPSSDAPSHRKGNGSYRTHRANQSSRQHVSGNDEKETIISSTPRSTAPSTDGEAQFSESIDEGLLSDSDEDDEHMYFQHPSQLLDMFSQLEERNLFLIQNVQETEENLEELRHKFNEMDSEMATKASSLADNISQLKGKIQREEERSEQLTRRKELMGVIADALSASDATSTSTSLSALTSDNLLENLVLAVRAVHAKCGFDGDAATDTLDALRDIEGWLEHLLHELQCMDPVKVEAAEKKKNAERRTLIREAKRQEQQRLYEERLAKSAARANAQVVRRTGKPVMFRSLLKRNVKREENVTLINEEEEEMKRFFTV